jgi:hypothetical protein
MHIRTAWNDYFPETSTNNLVSQTYNSRQTPSGTSVYVSNCLFISITSTSNGGALYCYNSATYFLVESSSFFSCKTSGGHGGAIYSINGNSGQSVLDGVCCYDCCSTYTNSPYFQCVYTYVKKTALNKNYANYTSISRCVNENSNSLYTFDFDWGKICFTSFNLSLNKCSGKTFYIAPVLDSNSVTCSFLFSTFADNIATDCTCIILVVTGAKYEIKSCNILRNTQGSLDSEGTIYTYGNVMIEDSCILENEATYVFRQYSSYPITLSNCTVDSTSNNGYLTIQNTITKSFIQALNHISTRNCHSEYDSVGTLTPIIQPGFTSKKQKHCCTCGKLFYQYPHDNFILLICCSLILKLLLQ